MQRGIASAAVARGLISTVSDTNYTILRRTVIDITAASRHLEAANLILNVWAHRQEARTLTALRSHGSRNTRVAASASLVGMLAHVCFVVIRKYPKQPIEPLVVIGHSTWPWPEPRTVSSLTSTNELFESPATSVERWVSRTFGSPIHRLAEARS